MLIRKCLIFPLHESIAYSNLQYLTGSFKNREYLHRLQRSPKPYSRSNSKTPHKHQCNSFLPHILFQICRFLCSVPFFVEYCLLIFQEVKLLQDYLPTSDCSWCHYSFLFGSFANQGNYQNITNLYLWPKQVTKISYFSGRSN